MRTKILKKGLSILLALTMVLAFVPAQPVLAAEPTAQDVADGIESYNSAFEESVSGDTVTVTGTVNNAESALKIYIPSGVTVVWNAKFSEPGTLSGAALLELTGAGTFNLDKSGSISCALSKGTLGAAVKSTGVSMLIQGVIKSGVTGIVTDSDIEIAGGTVTGGDNAIHTTAASADLTVTGGTVSSTNSQIFTAVWAATGSKIVITDGSVQSVDGVQPVDGSNTPVYRVPVQVGDTGSYDIIVTTTSYYSYKAETDESGMAYVWVPAGEQYFDAMGDEKTGNLSIVVTSGPNAILNIPVYTEAEKLAATITAYNAISGGTGQLDAVASGSKVTVSGSLTGVTTGTKITIPSDLKVIWNASLTGAVNSSLIFLNGDGTFELAAGEITNTGTGMALDGIKGSFVISGGTASSSSDVATVDSYFTGEDAMTLTMTGGTVISTSTSTASSAICAGGKTVITGGTITSASGNQVYLNMAVVVYRSGLLSKIASDSFSASIAVDPSKTYASPTETEGLTATGYSLVAGNVTAHWAASSAYFKDGTGIWVDYTYGTAGSGTWKVSYPDVKVVGYKQALTYDANGGSGSMTGTTVYYDQAYTVSANAFTKSGSSFTGWNTQADGKGTAYAAGAVLTGAASSDDVTLYAQWSTASSGGGKGSGGSSTGTTPAPTAPSASVSDSTATATVKPTIGTDGKATADVTADQIGDALKKAKEAAKTGDSLNVKIKVEGTSGVNSVAATIPSDSIKSLATGGITGLTVSSGLGDLTFGKDALKTISGAAAGDVKVTASKAETSTLSDDAKKLIGSHPVYEFSVTSDGKTISEFGGTVTASLPYTPAAGEDPKAIVIYYVAADGTLTMVPDAHYDASTGMVVFTTTHFSTYAVGYNKVSFSDVTDTAWYSEAVTFLAARGITSGTTTTTFGSNAELTRGQFITMLLKAYGVAPNTNSGDNFADAGNTYYTDYLAAAKELGISDGIGGNLFAPNKAVTRQEMFAMLYNALESIDQQPDGNSGKELSDFSDAANVASWAKDAMTMMVETGTVSGNGGKLSPTSTTTRVEMAQVLYNLLGK